MTNSKLTPVIDAEQIRRRVMELGREIGEHYQGKTIHIICVLKGGFIFAADLMRALPVSPTIDFVRLASYGGGTESSGNVKFLADLSEDITDRHVLVVDDIIDTGHSMRALLDHLAGMHPASLELCVLIDKRERRVCPVSVEYVAFEFPGGFLVGYGMDHAELYRNLDALYVLDPSE
ncbi:hypoxanthine phosphoribosyltransferase [Oceanidesulfovibrio indonesiensis]|uniref:Hypoxanthine phosphoribosyltransferase n=1 Tax=Oceanidesulfovibrio indonesiensis TaxID=54767 RepID=A0A7M3MHD0_9BACT|nr:hypoxanthine phosphoribosyltransferase [Oceanidesulfovibrio indonesiensis]TVM18425.1 hypoxanthine phosphoribosyltransferase [Oceanidesulfovibrio indonesiensis]